MELLVAAGVVCGAVRSFDEILADPYVHAAGMLARVPGERGGGNFLPVTPFDIDDHREPVSAAVTGLCADTDGILRELGMSTTEIDLATSRLPPG
ncbi:hypothetical protein A6035_13910 [Dietzia lutea]|uniref:CoA-transferase n=1 Tax=Dietzia lutea TaxID=546160 RepID=A0A2S1RA02_9ACTN|nr:hypothetical protein [Dietzia lutea]AWH93085.1 hypothetical protein A6035_13910 [Dietzia lutea]